VHIAGSNSISDVYASEHCVRSSTGHSASVDVFKDTLEDADTARLHMEGGWHELLVVYLYQEFDLVTSYAER
jgi:hypothetical protein